MPLVSDLGLLEGHFLWGQYIWVSTAVLSRSGPVQEVRTPVGVTLKQEHKIRDLNLETDQQHLLSHGQSSVYRSFLVLESRPYIAHYPLRTLQMLGLLSGTRSCGVDPVAPT